MTGSSLAWGAAGTLSIYSVDQVTRQVYGHGHEGAMLERQAQTFEQVSRHVGVHTAAMIASIKDASNQTVTDTAAMSYATQILAQKWSSSSENIITDTGALASTPIGANFPGRKRRIPHHSGSFRSPGQIRARGQ